MADTDVEATPWLMSDADLKRVIRDDRRLAHKTAWPIAASTSASWTVSWPWP
jgi:hypothetical protein